MHEECYACGALATSQEHAPPECFFPEGYRSGLVTVPSCYEHNVALHLDVEYVRNNICGQYGTNLLAQKVFFESAKASYDHSPKLLARNFAALREIMLNGTQTGAYSIELPRFRRVMKAIAYAMYYLDFGKRNEGDFDLFSTSLSSASNLYQHRPDGYEEMRRVLAACAFKSMPVSHPRVFKYGISRPGEGQIHYKFEFYEGFNVYALTLPYKLTPLIYLPVTRDCTAFRLGRD
jgi:hypothetical protein